jgi:WD40 repeat protein
MHVSKTGRACLLQVLSGHGGFVTSATIGADGRKAVTTSGDALGMVWDLGTGELLATLQGHSATVSAAVMTRKSRCRPECL